MLKMRLFAIMLWFCGASMAQVADKPNVAVLPFSGDKSVSVEQLEFITSKFTGELIATNAFKVLDRGKMEFILQEQGFQQSGACNSSECKVQMGQMLGVDKMVAGKLVRFGKTYALHIDYIDVVSGEIAFVSDVEEKGELEDSYKPLCRLAAQNLQAKVLFASTSSAVGDVGSSTVPADAIPSSSTQPMSTKRKVALALWGTTLAGAGAGFYFDGQTSDYADDYRKAIADQDVSGTQDAYDNTQSSKNWRNASYGVSAGTALLGLVLWFWPEGK